MSMLVSWLLFPVVLGVLALGCGLLLEQVAGFRLPGALLLPLGFSAIAVTGLLATTNGTTARLATPLVLALAVAGLGLSYPWRERRLDRWAGAAAALVFAVFGAPVFLSGQATFAGYIKLDDTANWLGLTDGLMEHGRTLSGLAPSTYQAMLNYYWNLYGYPMGAFPPLGVGRALVGADSAWLFQPYLCFLAAMLALSLYAVVARLIRSPGVRALGVFVAAQPALLYGYALWGGVKELAVAALLVLVATLIPSALREGAPVRSLLPLATASAALIGVLNLSGGAWIAPVLAPALAAGIRLRGRAFARVVAAFVGFTAVLSLPSFLSVGSFFNAVSLNTRQNLAGNLVRPLSWLQIFGVWPVGDFRLRPGQLTLTYILIGVLIAAAAGGLVWAARRREWEVLLYVAAAIVGCVVASWDSSPWVTAKALAIASPAILIAGMAGVAWLFRGGRRVEAAVVTVAIAGGVLWSNALAYHAVWLAPHGQLTELEHIGKRFAEDGPTLVTEYEFYGVRHFLRHMDAVGAGEGWPGSQRPPLLSGQVLPNGGFADIDAFQVDGILAYRTLVLGRSPTASRPPSVYRLVWKGRFYDVWQRPLTLRTRILKHASLGGGDQAVEVPRCQDVLRLASGAAQGGGVLAAVIRPPATVLPLSQASHPASWTSYSVDPNILYPWSLLSGNPDVVYPTGSGTLTATAAVEVAGRYGVWIGRAFRRRLEVLVDGRPVGADNYELNNADVYTQLGEVELQAGSHEVVLRSGGASLDPGSGGPPFPVGPLILSRYTAELPVTYVQPRNASSLCGKSLDWVEAVVR